MHFKGICAGLIMVIFLACAAAQAQTQMYTVLKNIPDLPYIPPYNGKMIDAKATEYTQPAGGGRYVRITFECAEPGGTVLEFYQSALRSNQWTIDKNKSREDRLYAKHGNSTCTIWAMNTFPKKGYTPNQIKTFVRISYRQI